MNNHSAPVALVTGAARRIGAHIAGHLHKAGYNLVLHYRGSRDAAQALCDDLNSRRPESAIALQADLADVASIRQLAKKATAHWGHLDLLINNASSFYPTPLPQADEQHWDDLISSNLKGPYFLCQALADELKNRNGSIINMADIHGDQPLANHSIYCIAKAGNRMLTKSLAVDLAPEVRVNGIAPGAILWPEDAAELNDSQKNNILDKVPLKRVGSPEDIAQAMLFLVRDAQYMTGQIIAVDGGRSA